MDSAIFSQEPLSGVDSGMIPWATSHSTNAGVLWPARLSRMSSTRKGGRSWGRVKGMLSPCCQCSQAARCWHFDGARLRGRQRRHDIGEFLFKPGVQHRVRSTGHALDAHLAGGRVKQRQQLGCAMAHVLVRVATRADRRLPAGARLGDGPGRTRFILRPDRQAQLSSIGIRLLDQSFLRWRLDRGPPRRRACGAAWPRPSCTTCGRAASSGRPRATRTRSCPC